MNSIHFQHFSTSIKGIKLPSKFTFPFYYEPHILSKIAAKELQEYLETQTEFNHNFGLKNTPTKQSIGKMFGVLVVKNKQQEIGYLCAFSGKLQDESLPSKFVPPIFNMRTEGSFYKKGENEINEINKQLSKLENNKQYNELKEIVRTKSTLIAKELETLKNKMNVAKKERRNRKIIAEKTLHPNDFTLLKKAIKQESFNDQFLLKELTEYREQQILENKKELEVFISKIEKLKIERKEKSIVLQQRLFGKYQFLNQQKETKGITDIFPNFEKQKPPAGAGDCSAPKLLQYAFLHDLEPITMAEFWWGISPNKEIRKHQNFYPACQGRCKPILTHMLDGIKMDENPLLNNSSKGKKIEIIYEDEALVVVHKPAEFLTVPGKEISDSVYTRVKKMYPNATGPLIIHRLDMSTSGILLISKTKEANKKLQSQFIKRTVRKSYIALLDGIIEQEKGEINLPLRLDIDDRPRQLVCFEHGKTAQTKWKVIERLNNSTTRIHLHPITGRTHQLRVHVSHPLGLNTPIIGDDLYGKKANRLHLHAESIEFEHPISKERMHFKVPPNF